jgi:hypothetical protein
VCGSCGALPYCGWAHAVQHWQQPGGHRKACSRCLVPPAAAVVVAAAARLAGPLQQRRPT